MTNLDKYRKDLDRILENGLGLQTGFLNELGVFNNRKDKKEFLEKNKAIGFKSSYELWYSEALMVIKQLLPNRIDDFVRFYKIEKRKQIDSSTYTISDYLIGITLTSGGETIVDGRAAFPKFQQQLNILKSVRQRFKSSLFEIKQLVRADLFDSELETARELNKKGFHRASGVICGVIIEKHLGEVCVSHKIAVAKKNPTISDYNDLLKSNDVVDVAVWRFIQGLGDIRNLCGHNKDREPTKDEVEELVLGTDKIIKTIY